MKNGTPHTSDASTDSVRVYPHNAPADAEAAEHPEPDLLDSLIECRKMERDLAQMARDPAGLPGYHDLPESVRALASRDPMRFWLLWQLSQSGVDLHEIDALRVEMQQQVDAALRANGWDGASAPTDEQLERAGTTVRQLMME